MELVIILLLGCVALMIRFQADYIATKVSQKLLESEHKVNKEMVEKMYVLLKKRQTTNTAFQDELDFLEEIKIKNNDIND